MIGGADFLWERPDWYDQAACRGLSVELFYPTIGDNEMAVGAQRVCRTCPVGADCLAFALETGERHGIWFLPPKQRQKHGRQVLARMRAGAA